MLQSKKQKNITFAVFGIYLFLLVWLILFKFSTSFHELDHMRNINLVPFGESMMVNGKVSFDEIIYNILVFVPFGVYIALLIPEWTIIKKIASCASLSLLFEVLQFVFAIGTSDITDLIGNTLGGIFGIGLCRVLMKVFRNKYVTVINGIGIAVEVVAVVMLGVLIGAN